MLFLPNPAGSSMGKWIRQTGICVLVIFCFSPCHAETSRISEQMLLGPSTDRSQLDGPAASSTSKQTQAAPPTGRKQLKPPPSSKTPPSRQSHRPTSQPKKSKVGSAASGNSHKPVTRSVTQGLHITPQSCRQIGASVTCSLRLTSPDKAATVLLFCYSGITAIDAEKNLLQCNEVRLGDQRSWEFAQTLLDPDTTRIAEIDFSSTGPVQKLARLQVTFSVDGQRQVAQWDSITVR